MVLVSSLSPYASQEKDAQKGIKWLPSNTGHPEWQGCGSAYSGRYGRGANSIPEIVTVVDDRWDKLQSTLKIE